MRAPRSFLDAVLWPEFQLLDAALTAYLADVTDKIIREEVFSDASDAAEVAEPLQLA